MRREAGQRPKPKPTGFGQSREMSGVQISPAGPPGKLFNTDERELFGWRPWRRGNTRSRPIPERLKSRGKVKPASDLGCTAVREPAGTPRRCQPLLVMFNCRMQQLLLEPWWCRPVYHAALSRPRPGFKSRPKDKKSPADGRHHNTGAPVFRTKALKDATLI